MDVLAPFMQSFLNTDSENDATACIHSLTVYPTERVAGGGTSSENYTVIIWIVVVVAVVLLSAIIFFLYDWSARRKHRQVSARKQLLCWHCFVMQSEPHRGFNAVSPKLAQHLRHKNWPPRRSPSFHPSTQQLFETGSWVKRRARNQRTFLLNLLCPPPKLNLVCTVSRATSKKKIRQMRPVPTVLTWSKISKRSWTSLTCMTQSPSPICSPTQQVRR